ncbi:unnamed protein product [Pseudo-nitzschia multistriata]|uniref:Tyr recombinase domain-containing protein n=1 Tax=Pseudo-nitzschia multistriata TaxID=183589 RepID=A0A448ZH14_9STRA|nr:unnamed protein product [Pseudo-nitzschia multistriata]
MAERAISISSTSMPLSRSKKRQRLPRIRGALRFVPLIFVAVFQQEAATKAFVATAFRPPGTTAKFPFHRHCTGSHVLSIPEADALDDDCKERIAGHIIESGIWKGKTDDPSSSDQLLLLARDFVDRPEVFSSLLMSDFGFPALVAHQTRALAMAAIRREQAEVRREAELVEPQNTQDSGDASRTSNDSEAVANPGVTDHRDGVVGARHSIGGEPAADEKAGVAAKRFSHSELQSSVVNERARRRMRSLEDYNYGLPSDYAKVYPKLASELDEYYTFMTQPSTYSQESPIRDATAKVYMNHAKLFLGWCCRKTEGNRDETEASDASLFALIPNKDKESADHIIRFVLWLRSREISVSYEANLLRGIIKLLKFRFARESNSDPLEGQNTFDDIPLIREVRKLHRDANQRQRLAPRSSDETKKWITWKDYLEVVRKVKNEVLELIEGYENLPASERTYPGGEKEGLYSRQQKKVAEAYQRYLILAILASIPDRQRTLRELEVGRTLAKDPETGCWTVKHGPGDYKTGKHYGERPAMQLAEELTPAIDDFLARWRPALEPSTGLLLVQARTGKPMTSNSVFKRVVRCCFQHTGKKANPHLLRDILVTHVRETEASEKELEALALYMGHSIQMQRTSYDRRTLGAKVAPAVELMRSVNGSPGGRAPPRLAG